MSRLLLLILFTPWLLSCSNHGIHKDMILNVPEYDLAGTIISIIEPEVASLPEYLVLCNNELLIANETFSDKAITIYDLSGKLIKSGIQYGQGPNEVLEVTSLHTIDGIPYIYDSRKGNIYQIHEQQELAIDPVTKDIRMHDDALMLPSYILIAKIASSNSYCLIDSTGNICDSLSYFPPAPKNVDSFTHSLACTGHLALHKDSLSFMRALGYDGGVDFFRIKDGKVFHQNRFEIFPMEYSIVDYTGTSVPIPSKESRNGFIHVAVSENFFYASFSESKSLDNPSGNANKIYKFDLKGNVLSKYNLDQSIKSFAVTPTDSEIIAISLNSGTDETNIISFNIQ